MCAANTAKESPPRSAHSSGRASGLRSEGLDTTGPDPPIEATSPRLTTALAGMFRLAQEEWREDRLPMRLESQPKAAPITASINLYFWSARTCGNFLETRAHRPGHAIQTLGRRRGFSLCRHRHSRIAAEPDPWVNFDFAEHRHAILDRCLRAFAVPENIHGFAAVRAGKRAHVFHHAEHFHAYLPEHFDGFANIRQRHRRRSRHHNRSGHSHGLNQSQLHVARAWRQVDNQVIQLAPFHATQKLRDHAVQHGTTPDDRFVPRVQQAHRDHLHALRNHRNNALLRGRRWLCRRAEHDGHVRSVYVPVQQADLVAEFRERESQIYGDGGFSHTAFPASNRHKIPYSRNRMTFRHLSWHCPRWHGSMVSLNQSVPKPSETLQVARAQAAARRDHTVCPPLRADKWRRPSGRDGSLPCGLAKASIKRLTLDRSLQTGLPGASSACAVALLIFFPRTARTRIVASHFRAGSYRLGGFCLRGPGLILHLLLLPFLLALECPRKVRQALRRHLHAGRRTGSGRCGWRRSKRSRRLRPWLARLLRRRFTLLDLHVEEVAHRFVVDARHHVFEQDKGFLLEFDKWILLAVATKPDPLLQMVERKQVVFPLRVDDIENDAALEPTEEFCAELFLFLRVAIPHRFDGRFHQLIMIQGCRIRACRFCLDSELAMHFGEKLRGVPLARMLLARAIGFDCLERHILRDSEDVIALVLVFEGEEESRRARVALASRAASQLVVDAARLVALRTQNVQAAKGHNVVVLRLALFGELLVDRLPLFLRHLENLAFVLEQHHGRCCLRGVAVCAFRTDDRGRGGVRHGQFVLQEMFARQELGVAA